MGDGATTTDQTLFSEHPIRADEGLKSAAAPPASHRTRKTIHTINRL